MASVESLCVLLRAAAGGLAEAGERTFPPSLLVLPLKGRRFGLPLGAAVRIENLPSLEEVPGAPQEVLGLAALSDGYLPVFDPGVLLGVGASEAPRFVVVIQHGEARAAIALERMPELGERTDGPGFSFISAEELLRLSGTITGGGESPTAQP